MEIIFQKVDLKSTKLSEVKAGMLFVENIEDLNKEESYMIKLGFDEKDSKVFAFFVLNESQPTVFSKDADRSVFVISHTVNLSKNSGTYMLNSVKQQTVFIFKDDTKVKKTLYLKTDKTKQSDIGIIEIGKHGFLEDKIILDFSGKKIVFKEGDRKIITLDVKFQLNFDEKDQGLSGYKKRSTCASFGVFTPYFSY